MAGWLRRLPPVVGVLPAVLFNLVILRGERLAVAHVNDSAMHEQMVRFARTQLETGDLPLHAWYPWLQLGLPHFQHYPSLGHTVAGAASAVTGLDTVYQWSIYLVLALFPLSVYKAARVLDLRPLAATVAATTATLAMSEPGYGQELNSYIWRGYGVWGQLLAMAVLPLALAYGWRAIRDGRGYARAAGLLGLTMLLHFLTGWLGAVTLGTVALVMPRQAFARLRRAVGVLIAAVCVASFELVPLLRGSRHTAFGEAAHGTFFMESFGARRILGWLVSGELYDAGRLPALTVLVAIGLACCVARWRDEQARVLLAFWLLSLLLFFGPVTWGSLLDKLPGGSTVLFHRFVFGVHLAGFLLAGYAVATLAGVAVPVARRLRPAWPAVTGPAVVLVAVAVALVPAWRTVAAFAGGGRDMIEEQRLFEDAGGRDVRALVAQAKSYGDGRVYAGMRSGWGAGYLIGFVPVYAIAADEDADAVGFTFRAPSLMSDLEAYFDEMNPAHYDVFGIRYLIFPVDREPPVPATQLATRGQHILWGVDTTGYLRAVDTTSTVAAGREGVNTDGVRFLQSRDAAAGRFGTIGFDGDEAVPPTAGGGALPKGPPGRVLTRVALLDDGEFAARVELDRPATVVLKVAYNPQWRAYVDGVEAPVAMVSPALVGVNVPAGTHAVTFRFRSWTPTWAFVLLGALALGVAWWAGRRRPLTFAPAAAGVAAAPPVPVEPVPAVDLVAPQPEDAEEERRQHRLDAEDERGDRRDDDPQAAGGVEGAEVGGAPPEEPEDRPDQPAEHERPAGEQADLQRDVPEQPVDAGVGGEQPLGDGEDLREDREDHRLESDHDRHRGVEEGLDVEPDAGDVPPPR